MKAVKTVLVVLLALAIIVIAGCLPGGCSGRPSADLGAIKSDVERFDVSASKAELVPEGKHRTMYEGDGVAVDQSGYAELDMGGCVLAIFRDTDLRMTGLPSESAPVCIVDFEHGTIFNRVQRQMIVNTEWAVITTLGTDFLVHLDPNREMIWLIVKDGVVQVEAADESVKVRADQQTWVQRGHAPEPPVPTTRQEVGDLFPPLDELTNNLLPDGELLGPEEPTAPPVLTIDIVPLSRWDPTTRPDVTIPRESGCHREYNYGDEIVIFVMNYLTGNAEIRLDDEVIREEWLSPAGIGWSWTFEDLGPGDHQFSVVVSDEFGEALAESSCPFHLKPGSEVSIWLAGGCQREYNYGDPIVLYGRAYVPGNAEIRLDNQLIEEIWLTPGEPWHSPWTYEDRQPGDHEFSIVLSDEFGEVLAENSCPFHLKQPIPEVSIRLEGGCHREYIYGDETLLLAEANVDGNAEIWLDDQLIEEIWLTPGRPWDRLWTFEDVEPGDHQFSVVLRDESGEVLAENACPFGLKRVPEVSIWLAEGCDRVYEAGFPTQVFFRSNVNASVALSLDDQELFPAREVAGGQTYAEDWQVVEEPGEHRLRAILGDQEAVGECRFFVRELAQVLFDFVEEADSAVWVTPYGKRPFDMSHSEMGFALWQYDAYLEDGTRPGRVLVTHPGWKPDEHITGLYDQTQEISLQEGDLFIAQVGFLKDAWEGEVTFSLQFRQYPYLYPILLKRYYQDQVLGGVRDSHDGELREWTVPLDGLVGQHGYFALQVEAGEVAEDDWAVWVVARLERPSPTLLPPRAYQTVNLSRIATETVLPPGEVTLGGIPFHVPEGANAFTTQAYAAPGNPTEASLQLQALHPTDLYLLIAAGEGYTRYAGCQVAMITLTFADEAQMTIPLVLGDNLRECEQEGPGTVNSATDPSLQEVWRSGVEIVDMLRISIGPPQSETGILTAIAFADTSEKYCGSFSPALGVFGVTVLTK